jgi:hopanoid biosynthesis associated protein HpnK
VLRLIVNADDFGLTSGVNRGIAEAHAKGIVTSATLMANGPTFSEAIEMAQAMPRLAIGCHVTLVDGIPVLKPTQVPSLLSGKNAGDNNSSENSALFRTAFSSFALASALGKLSGDEIAAEATAQIRKLQNAGIQVSHFDTHKHVHLFPKVLAPILRAAKACGVPAVRNPFGPVRILHLRAQPSSWKRWTQVSILNSLSGKFQRAVAKSGLRTTNGTIGVVGTGSMTAELFQLLLKTIPTGTWEFVCHPGYLDDDLRAAGTRLLASRETELQMLTAAEMREFLQSNNIVLSSYRDLIG